MSTERKFKTTPPEYGKLLHCNYVNSCVTCVTSCINVTQNGAHLVCHRSKQGFCCQLVLFGSSTELKFQNRSFHELWESHFKNLFSWSTKQNPKSNHAIIVSAKFCPKFTTRDATVRKSNTRKLHKIWLILKPKTFCSFLNGILVPPCQSVDCPTHKKTINLAKSNQQKQQHLKDFPRSIFCQNSKLNLHILSFRTRPTSTSSSSS